MSKKETKGLVKKGDTAPAAPAAKVAVAKVGEPKGEYPDYTPPTLTGAHQPGNRANRAKGMSPGDLVVAHGIVGLVPFANSKHKCNAEKTGSKEALEAGEMTRTTNPNQGWTAACAGSRIGPDLGGSGGCFLVGSPSEMTYGVRQIATYTKGKDRHRLLLTRTAWEALYFATIGAFDRITPEHRNALVPLEQWSEPTGDNGRKDVDFAYLGDKDDK